MRIMVLGHKGMLGKQVVKELEKRGHNVIPFRLTTDEFYEQYLSLQPNCDIVINCAGKIPQKNPNYYHMINSNATMPHILAKLFDCPIYHISTDCVFAGNLMGSYSTIDHPDALSLYGRTKLLGEVEALNVCNIRTSFIGPDHGLFDWIVNSSGTIDGWDMAYWSGSTVQEVARSLASFIELEFKPGIEHLSTLNKLSKYRVIKFIVKTLGLDIKINRVNDPWIDRGLTPTIHMKSVLELEYDIRECYDTNRSIRLASALS